MGVLSSFSVEIADPGAHHYRLVVGKDPFLPEGVLDLLTDVHPLLIDTIDHHGVQLHLDVQILLEEILQEVQLQFLDGDHLTPGEGHRRDIHPHLPAGDLMFAENHHCLGQGGHLLPSVVVLQLVHPGGHHLHHDEDLLFGTHTHQLDDHLDLQQGVDQDLHLQQGAGRSPHPQEVGGHTPHLLVDADHGLGLQ